MIDPMAFMAPLGVKIFVSELAVSYSPNRKHKKRRNQTEAYHRRVQKKWLKRFGEKTIPGAFQAMNGMYVHPLIYQALRKAAP